MIELSFKYFKVILNMTNLKSVQW